jgi:hypothetical protein
MERKDIFNIFNSVFSVCFYVHRITVLSTGLCEKTFLSQHSLNIKFFLLLIINLIVHDSTLLLLFFKILIKCHLFYLFLFSAMCVHIC